MLPVLLDLKFIKIYTFGVFLVLAFFWSTFLLWRNVSLTSYKEEDVFDGLFISLFGGLFIGRITYVALHFDKFGFSISKFLLINGYPGLSLYGILLGAFVSFFIFIQIKKIKFSEVIDYAVPPIFIALGIGKIGSFFSGVEVGVKTKFPIALKYANFDGMRQLTPLYEAIFFFIAAYFAHRLLFAIRRNQFSKGLGFFYFGWVFSLVYFIMDPLKTGKATVLGQSANWVVSAGLLLTFSIYLLYHLRTHLFGNMAKVTNSIKHNAKNRSKIHHRTPEEVGTGTEESSRTDTET